MISLGIRAAAPDSVARATDLPKVPDAKTPERNNLPELQNRPIGNQEVLDSSDKDRFVKANTNIVLHVDGIICEIELLVDICQRNRLFPITTLNLHQ